MENRPSVVPDLVRERARPVMLGFVPSAKTLGLKGGDVFFAIAGPVREANRGAAGASVMGRGGVLTP